MLSIEDMAAFCRRKGFVYPSADIYGGIAGFWDFGHLGVGLKNAVKQELWRSFVLRREDIVGIDGSIITNPLVWKASGHLESFTDLLLPCKKCGPRTRADLFLQDKGISAEGMSPQQIAGLLKKHKLSCEKCGGAFGSAHAFNLMFSTAVGPASGFTAYLRPETAQSIFPNFALVMEHNRMKLPFGIAQLGKAFRNEISPRDFLFRSREFEQFELEFFVDPGQLHHDDLLKDALELEVQVLTAEMQREKQEHASLTIKQMHQQKLGNPWQLYWLAQFHQWFLLHGIRKENLRIREHLKDELAHYALSCFDIEYRFPFGWKEIHGNADRGAYDLKQHMQHAQSDLTVFQEERREKIIPLVASEPSQGIERALLAFLFDAYEDSKERGNVVLHLDSRLAPVQVAVFPLVNKLITEARQIAEHLRQHFTVFFDKSGSIGRRYARQDEIGTPYCITIDFDSLQKKDATIRDRDTTQQVRVKIAELPAVLRQLISQEIPFAELQK